jgi:hypothetical protein
MRCSPLRSVAEDLQDPSLDEFRIDASHQILSGRCRGVDGRPLEEIRSDHAERQPPLPLQLRIDRKDRALIRADRRNPRVVDRCDSRGRGLGQPVDEQLRHRVDRDRLDRVDDLQNG